MERSNLVLPARLLASDSNEPVPGEDDLSSPTVRFTPISLRYVLDFWADVQNKVRAPDVELYRLNVQVEELLPGRTGRLERVEGTFSYLSVPFREKGLVKVATDKLTFHDRSFWTTEEIVQNIILPEMMAEEKAVVDTVDKKYVGRPFQGYFVSQARACRFGDLVSSLHHHFSNNPPDIAILSPGEVEKENINPSSTSSEKDGKENKFSAISKLKVNIARKLSSPDKKVSSSTAAANQAKKAVEKKKRFSGMQVDFSKIFVWIDVFDANQPQLCAQHPDPEVQLERYKILQKGLHSALGHFEDRVIFFDNFTNPTAISRAWCVWELYGVALHRLSLSIVCPPTVAEDLEQQFLTGQLQILNIMSNLEPRKMQCFNPEDLEMIKTAVEGMEGGFVTLKQTITDTLRRWMLNFANDLREKRLKAHLREAKKYETSDGDLLYRIAIVLNNFGENQLSIDYSEAAIEIYQSLDDKLRIAYVWRALGKVYLNLKDARKALEYHEKELEYYQVYIATTGRAISANDDDLLGGCYWGIGNALYGIDKFQEAVDNYEKAYQYYIKGHGERSFDAAQLLTCKARALQPLGKFDEALEMFNRALEIKQELLGERNVNLAYDYSNRAWLYQAMKQWDNALKDMFMTWELRREVLGEMHDMTALSYNHIAYCYRLQEKWDQSTEFYLKSIAIYEVIHPNETQTADLYNNLGFINSRIPRYDKCLEYYERAKEIYYAAQGPESAMAKQMEGYIVWAKGNIPTGAVAKN